MVMNKLGVYLKFLSDHDTVLDVTVAIDVGLHRDGVQPEDAVEFFQKASMLPNINATGTSSMLVTCMLPV